MSSDPPPTIESIRKVVRSYRGTPVDALFWCGGDREVFTYDTKVGEVFGQRHTVFSNAGDRRTHRNIKTWIESGKCILASMAEVCHQEGLDFFVSVRMNTHYEVDPASPSESGLRLNHPEWLIGSPPGYSKGSKEHSIRMGLNYARPEVRKHMAAIVIELFERFDVNGVELDFMRHPVFFKFHEAYANHHLMTGMLRYIRRRMHEVSRARGKKFELAVRVPASFSAALGVGLDVRTWVREALVDILIAGGGFVPFDMPFREFVEAVKGTPCQLYGCLEAARTREEELVRAIAMKYWTEGADGLYLFNFFSRGAEWKEAPLFREAGDPRVLAGLDKRYQLDRKNYSPGVSSHLGSVFDTAIPSAQLPAQLYEDFEGAGATLTFSIADDLALANSQGKLKETRLQLGFDENHSSEDKLEVKLNGQTLVSDGPVRAGTLEYDAPIPSLRQGANQIQVRVTRRTRGLTSPLVLQRVEVAVRYK